MWFLFIKSFYYDFLKVMSSMVRGMLLCYCKLGLDLSVNIGV